MRSELDQYNRNSGARGASALRAHRARSFNRGEGRDVELRELLADLHHYADAAGLNWGEALTEARRIHIMEVRDVEEARKAADHA